MNIFVFGQEFDIRVTLDIWRVCWRVSGRYLLKGCPEVAWSLSGVCLEGVWRVSMGCLNRNIVSQYWWCQDRSSKVRSSQDMSSPNRFGQDWSSPVKTGQVNLDQILNQERSSQVGIDQIKLWQVKLCLDWLNQMGQVKQFLDPRFFGSNFFYLTFL